MPITDPEKLKAARARDNAKRAGKRSRSWACIVYPESAPSGWVDALSDSHVELLISPLHDSDVTAEGAPKKPHYHVLALFPNPAPERAAREVFECAGVTAPPENVKNAKGYARYLVHLDDHDKHRYDEADIVELGGASWESMAFDEGEIQDRILDEIEDWVDAEGVVSYHALCRYARKERPEWTHVVRHNSIHLTALLKSYAWELAQEAAR